MKTFSRLLGIVALFFVAFFLIGVMVPSISYEIQLEMDQPQNVVFQALTNSELLPEWVSGLESSELVKGETGKAGSVYEMLVNDGGRIVEFQEEVIRFEPDSVLMYTLETKELSGTVTIKCLGNGNTSQLQVYTELEGNVWFARSFLPLLKSTIEDRTAADYNRLSSILQVTD